MRAVTRAVPVLVLVCATTAAAEGQDRQLLDEAVRIQSNHIMGWNLTLAEDAQVSLQIIVRNSQPLTYYWVDPADVENFSGSGDSVYHVEDFCQSRANDTGVNESACLAAGVYSLRVVNHGSEPANCRVVVNTAPAPARARVLSIQRPPTGNVGRRGDGAGRYRLWVTAYNVSPTQTGNDDAVWDNDGTTADVMIQLYDSGNGDGISNVQRLTDETPGTDNIFARARPGSNVHTQIASWEFDWNGYGDVVLAVWDRDLGGWDLVGAGPVQSGSEVARAQVTVRGDSQRYTAVGTATLHLAWEKLR